MNNLTSILEILQERAADGQWRTFYQDALDDIRRKADGLPDSVRIKYADRIREVELARDHSERLADAAALGAGSTSPIYKAFEKAMDTGTPPPPEILAAAHVWVERYLSTGQQDAADAMQDRIEMWTR
jgi:hypothetical protein